MGLAISPDDKWVASTSVKQPAPIVLLPAGAGQPVILGDGQLFHTSNLHFLPDGKGLIMVATEKGKAPRTYVLMLDGSAKAAGGTEKAVAALEQQWLQSQKANNPDLVAPLLADKFIMTGVDGKVTGKAESLATAKATKYDSVDYDNVKVTVFGNTAIATGGFKAKGTDPSGKPLDAHERWTDTWVKMPNGQWQCVASHSSPVKM